MNDAVIGDLIVGTTCLLFVVAIITRRTLQFFRNTINKIDYLTFVSKVIIMTIVMLGFVVAKLMIIHVVFESSADNSVYLLFNFISGSLVTFITLKVLRDKNSAFEKFMEKLLNDVYQPGSS